MSNTIFRNVVFLSFLWMYLYFSFKSSFSVDLDTTPAVQMMMDCGCSSAAAVKAVEHFSFFPMADCLEASTARHARWPKCLETR